MRLIPCLILAAVLQLSGVASAQQIAIGGWVDRVDMSNSTLTLRTLANPRTLSVSPNAIVRINGAVSTLGRLPINSTVDILAEKDTNGVLRAVQIDARTSTPQPSAGAPPGAIVRGTLVGMNLPANTITLRTPAGNTTIDIGTAPIIVNGARGSSRDLHVGQMIRIDRALPTPASSDYVTQAVRILPAAGAAGALTPPNATGAGGARGPDGTGGMAAPAAGAVSHRTVYTRTRSYRATTRSRYPGARHVVRRTSRSRSRYRYRRTHRRRIMRTYTRQQG